MGITLLKNNYNKKWDDETWVEVFHDFLTGEVPEEIKLPRGYSPKLSRKQAKTVIWYLQELFPIIPDTIEFCDFCGNVYNSNNEGGRWAAKGKCFCDSCRYLVPENYDRGKK